LACRVQQLEEEVSAKEKAARDSHALIQTLESRVGDLEFEIAEKEPLYEVGVSVRARYLDKAKFVVLTPKERRGKLNQSQNLKVAGDSAAHNAIVRNRPFLWLCIKVIRVCNVFWQAHLRRPAYLQETSLTNIPLLQGSTDRLLFNEGVLPASEYAPHRMSPFFPSHTHLSTFLLLAFLSAFLTSSPLQNSQARLLPIFTKLYTLPPTAHAQLPEKMQRVLDHEGTIRTLLVLNTALRPLAERETAMVDIAYIRSRHALLERAEFERCADVERRLARVGEMTERIVGMDHKRTAAAEQPERAGVGEAW